MRYFRILLFLVITSSFLFPHNGRHKGWKHKKKHKIRKIHKKPRVNIRLGYNYSWPSWGWNHRWCYRKNSRDIVVVQNDKNILEPIKSEQQTKKEINTKKEGWLIDYEEVYQQSIQYINRFSLFPFRQEV